MLLRNAKYFVELRNCSSKFASTSANGKLFEFESNIQRSTLTVDIPQVDVSSHVWKDVKNWETKPALTCGESGRSNTYGQVHRSSETFSINLGAILGLKEGSKLAIVLPNIPEFATVFYGAASAGLISTTANPLYTKDELAKQFSDAAVSAVVTIPPLLEKVKAALKESSCGGGQIILVGGESTKKREVYSLQELTTKKIKGAKRPQKPDPEAPAIFPYSSGTTGVPKGVILTHRNLVSAICIADHPLAITQAPYGPFQEVTLATIPMFHIYGIVNILGLCMYRGYYIITLPKFEPSLFASTFSKYKPSYMCFVPPLMSFVARSPLISKKDLSHLKFAANAAAPLSMQIVGELTAKSGNPNLIVKNGYGLTETCALVTMTAHGFKKETIGTPGANTEAKIIDENGNALAMGEEGELCLRGPQIMKGYLHNEKATSETLTGDGWLLTGDVGFINPEDGNIHLVERKKELIKVKGFQVSPTELELVLLKMDGVADVAVIGVPHESHGEVPRAFIVRKSGSDLTEQDVNNFLSQKVAAYKQLKGGVKFVQQIPKSAAGKTMKKLLAQM